jgi:hypothetical protein
MAKRRSGDINRLTSDYQQAVSQYTSKVGEKEKVFQGEMDKYNAAHESYQQRASAYQSRITNYQKALDAYQKDPGRVVMEGWDAGGGMFTIQDGRQRRNVPIPAGGWVEAGKGLFSVVKQKNLANPGAFTEKFEEPTPTAPKLMDISAEKAALQSEKDYTDREIAERNKSRLRAVGRGAQRGMLSAGTNISTQA